MTQISPATVASLTDESTNLMVPMFKLQKKFEDAFSVDETNNYFNLNNLQYYYIKIFDVACKLRVNLCVYWS